MPQNGPRDAPQRVVRSAGGGEVSYQLGYRDGLYAGRHDSMYLRFIIGGCTSERSVSVASMPGTSPVAFLFVNAVGPGLPPDPAPGEVNPGPLLVHGIIDLDPDGLVEAPQPSLVRLDSSDPACRAELTIDPGHVRALRQWRQTASP